MILKIFEAVRFFQLAWAPRVGTGAEVRLVKARLVLKPATIALAGSPVDKVAIMVSRF